MNISIDLSDFEILKGYMDRDNEQMIYSQKGAVRLFWDLHLREQPSLSSFLELVKKKCESIDTKNPRNEVEKTLVDRMKIKDGKIEFVKECAIYLFHDLFIGLQPSLQDFIQDRKKDCIFFNYLISRYSLGGHEGLMNRGLSSIFSESDLKDTVSSEILDDHPLLSFETNSSCDFIDCRSDEASYSQP